MLQKDKILIIIQLTIYTYQIKVERLEWYLTLKFVQFKFILYLCTQN